MKYLGIDYGMKKVGLAVSEGTLASPLKVLQVTGLVDAVAKIGRVAEVEECQKLIIGLPESGQARKMVEEAVERLREKFEIEEVEETLSSQQAQSDMITMGFSREKRRAEDSHSAAILLQNYLDALTINK